jgi:hypothetical protein
MFLWYRQCVRSFSLQNQETQRSVVTLTDRALHKESNTVQLYRWRYPWARWRCVAPSLNGDEWWVYRSSRFIWVCSKTHLASAEKILLHLSLFELRFFGPSLSLAPTGTERKLCDVLQLGNVWVRMTGNLQGGLHWVRRDETRVFRSNARIWHVAYHLTITRWQGWTSFSSKVWSCSMIVFSDVSEILLPTVSLPSTPNMGGLSFEM